MTAITDALYDKALELSANVPDNFMDHLIEGSRTVEALAIPRDQLRKIGWSKLQLIAKHVTLDTLDAFLQLAEDTTAKDLERHLRGEKPAGNAHRVLKYFSPKQYKQLEGALAPYGGAPSGSAIK
jgi:hypothetical protein